MVICDNLYALSIKSNVKSEVIMFKILIVEDNKTLNYNYNELIEWEALGMCIVGNAFNGEQGLRMAKELKPDLVITDVDMPRLGGLEMCREHEAV